MLNLEPCYNGQTTSEERRLFSQRLFSRTVKFSGFQCSHRIYFKCGVEKTSLQIIATKQLVVCVAVFCVVSSCLNTNHWHTRILFTTEKPFFLYFASHANLALVCLHFYSKRIIITKNACTSKSPTNLDFCLK